MYLGCINSFDCCSLLLLNTEAAGQGELCLRTEAGLPLSVAQRNLSFHCAIPVLSRRCIVKKKTKKVSKNNYRALVSAVLQFSTALKWAAFFSPCCLRASFATPPRRAVFENGGWLYVVKWGNNTDLIKIKFLQLNPVTFNTSKHWFHVLNILVFLFSLTLWRSPGYHTSSHNSITICQNPSKSRWRIIMG